MEVQGTYYDGKTSRGKPVWLHLDGSATLRISGFGNELTYPFAEVRVAPRLGNTPRSLYLPGAAKCETLDNDAIDDALSRLGRHRLQRYRHALESRLRYVLLAVAMTVLAVWGLVVYGVPTLAERVAYRLPESVDQALGHGALEALDRTLMSASALSQERQAQLRARFQEMSRANTGRVSVALEFRESAQLGPNALALPSGIIVVTDDLVSIAEHENEILAVLAHELGHVFGRHSLRMLLQSSAVVLILASVTGDIASITTLSATMPTMFLDAAYSREFETQADAFALERLREHGIPLSHFVDILGRLDQASQTNAASFGYLSSHPSTDVRLAAFAEDTNAND